LILARVSRFGLITAERGIAFFGRFVPMHDHLLFIGNAFGHLVAAMSGVVSFAVSIVEAVRNKKFETWAFFVLGALSLFVAFDQAWQDEHRNSQELIAEKAAAVSERNFWKDQSYRKDDALRSRDELLAQNYGALIGQQTTSNKSQQSLAQLSNKIVELNAGCYRPDRRLTDQQRGFLFHQLTWYLDQAAKQHVKVPTLTFGTFTGDMESNNFARSLWDVFNDAGWPIKAAVTSDEQKNYKEKEDWMTAHHYGLSGVVFMESPSSNRAASTWLDVIFSQPKLSFANQWGVPFPDVPPHLENLVIWVGYKTYP
jgi:hypothetical protein